MTGLLRRIYRENFWPPAKRILVDRLEGDSTIDAGIAIEQASPLAGIIELSEWLKRERIVHARVSRTTIDLGTTEILREQQMAATDFDQAIAQLNQVTKMDVQQQTKLLKDGANYFVAWGDRAVVKTLSLSNPIEGSMLSSLVERLSVRVS